jgi:hypothetical protein
MSSAEHARNTTGHSAGAEWPAFNHRFETYRVPASEGRVSSLPLAYPLAISSIDTGV